MNKMRSSDYQKLGVLLYQTCYYCREQDQRAEEMSQHYCCYSLVFVDCPFWTGKLMLKISVTAVCLSLFSLSLSIERKHQLANR